MVAMLLKSLAVGFYSAVSLFHGVECQASPLCGDIDKVSGSVASVRYSEGLYQRCSTRNEFLLLENSLSSVQTKEKAKEGKSD